MAEIFPFRAYRYDSKRVKPADVLTQPYDKITPEMQERYYARGPYNLIAVEKGRSEAGDNAGNNVYTRARQALDKWIADGALMREAAPAVYAYFQDYTAPDTKTKCTRRGFIALCRVTGYDDRVVHRHEYTLSGPRADRLELLRHTRAHTGQLFMLYSDRERRIDSLLEQAAASPAAVEVEDEYGVTHRLWPVTDAAIVQQFVLAMADRKLVIADGHHRYETAVAYRDECRAAKGAAASPDDAHEKVMMTFVNTESAGLTILPTHRVLSNVSGFSAEKLLRALEPWFDARRLESPPESRGGPAPREAALRVNRGPRAIGFYAGGSGFWELATKPQADLASAIPDVSPAQLQLDVVLLHRLILEKGLGITPEAVVKESHIRYEREAPAAIAAVREGKAQACFLVNAVSAQQVLDIALAGEVLPQKSTDFYPKLLSGLTIYRLDG